MNSAFRAFLLVTTLVSSCEYCAAAQAATQTQPLSVEAERAISSTSFKAMKNRIGKLRERFAKKRESLDKEALLGLKKESSAIVAITQTHNNNKGAGKGLKENARKLDGEIDAFIKSQWPEPQRPGLWARLRSSVSYAKTQADSFVKFVVHGPEEQIAAKAAAQLNQNRAEIQRIAHDDRVEEAPIAPTAYQPQDPTLWGFTPSTAPTTQATVPPQIQAVPQAEQPRAVEVTPLTLEEQKKQTENIVIQAQHEKESKEKEEKEKTARAQEVQEPAQNLVQQSAALLTTDTFQTTRTEVPTQAPQEQTTAPTATEEREKESKQAKENLAVIQDDHLQGPAKQLYDYLDSYAKKDSLERTFFRTQALPAIIQALRAQQDHLTALAQCAFNNKDVSKDVFNKAFKNDTSYKLMIESAITGYVYAHGTKPGESEESKQAKIQSAQEEACTVMYDYTQQLKRKAATATRRASVTPPVIAPIATTQSIPSEPTPSRLGEETTLPKQEPSPCGKYILIQLRTLVDALGFDFEKQTKTSDDKQKLLAALKTNMSNIIRALENQPAILDNLAEVVRQHAAEDILAVKTAFQATEFYKETITKTILNRAEKTDVSNMVADIVPKTFVATVRHATFEFDRKTKRASRSWLKKGSIALACGGAVAFGAYKLWKLYPTLPKVTDVLATKHLPLLWKIPNNLAWKVVLPAAGIAAAGLLCYLSYRVYTSYAINNKAKEAKNEFVKNPSSKNWIILGKAYTATSKQTMKDIGDALSLGQTIASATGFDPVKSYLEGKIDESLENLK